MAHYHYGNGSVGCLYDSADVYARRRDAIEWAETLFGDCLCPSCFRDMSKALRSHAAKDGVTYYFNRECENEFWNGRCYAGADLVEITKERGGIRFNKYDEAECNC